MRAIADKKGAMIIAVALSIWTVSPIFAESYPADNTGKNVRDRDPGALTAGDQSSDEGDIAITQEVRKRLLANDALSTNAHNVKVITRSGVVTLRGPVDTSAEKATVARLAQNVSGVASVDDQLEVTSR